MHVCASVVLTLILLIFSILAKKLSNDDILLISLSNRLANTGVIKFFRPLQKKHVHVYIHICCSAGLMLVTATDLLDIPRQMTWQG